MLALRSLTGSLCLLLLAACGGGGSDGGGPPPTSISISPAAVTLNSVEGASLPAPTTVRVNFVGDGVVVGYAPGVAPPAWLTVTPVANTATTADFALAVSGPMTPSVRQTTVRFATGRADGSNVRSVDLPVTFAIAERFGVSTPTIAFEAIAGRTEILPQNYVAVVRGSAARWRVSEAPSWVTVNPAAGQGAGQVSIAANVSGLSFGEYAGQITFIDDQSGESRSLPASLTHRAARLLVEPASLSLEIDSASPVAALSRTLTITDEVGGAQAAHAVSWEIQSIDGAWLRASATSGSSAPAQSIAVAVDPSELAQLAAGDHQGAIHFTYRNAEVSDGTVIVPVTLSNRLARVDFAAPYVGVENVAGRIIARGENFPAAGAQVTIDVGAEEIGPVSVDSNTQVTIDYPALPAGRYPVSIRNAIGVVATTAELVVQASSTFAYQTIEAPGLRTRLVYDAERLELFAVNRDDQQIERYQYSGAAWAAAPAYVLPEVTDVELSPNGRSLIVLTRNAVNEVDLANSPWQAEQRVDNPDPFCGGFFDEVAISNDGQAFLIHNLRNCSGFSSSYLYDLRRRTMSRNPFIGSLYNGTVAASADGSRLYAGSNGVSPAQPVMVFDSLTSSIATGAVVHNLHAVSASGDASRVILQDQYVYNSSLVITGNLSPGGVALASRDASRAYVYRDDGGQARVDVYDLNGALQPGALYPVLETIALPDPPNQSTQQYQAIKMALSPDGRTLFISGDLRILVVPVN